MLKSSYKAIKAFKQKEGLLDEWKYYVKYIDRRWGFVCFCNGVCNDKSCDCSKNTICAINLMKLPVGLSYLSYLILWTQNITWHLASSSFHCSAILINISRTVQMKAVCNADMSLQVKLTRSATHDKSTAVQGCERNWNVLHSQRSEKLMWNVPFVVKFIQPDISFKSTKMEESSSGKRMTKKQVDILISKNQALQILLYSLNISREKTFMDFTDLWVTSKILTLKILSCITILYYVFAIREIFITKTLKAMNLRKF